MRRLVPILIVAAVTAFLLEVVLQIGALVVALSHAPEERDAGERAETTILCVGDSFTYGAGATTSEASYPAALERALGDKQSTRVVNLGWPGQDSHTVLRKLPNQIADVAPDIVCVLVGVNDTWSRPRRIETIPEPTQNDGDVGFVWRWRTARLVRWALGNRGAWANDPGLSLQRTAPKGRKPTAAMHRCAVDLLRQVGVPPLENPSTLTTTAAEVQANRQPVQTRLDGGDFAGALTQARTTLQHEGGADLVSAVIDELLARGERDAAAGAVDTAVESYESSGSAVEATIALRALEAVGDADRARHLAQRVVEAHPDLAEAWWILGRMIMATESSTDEAVPALRRYLTLLHEWELPAKAVEPLRRVAIEIIDEQPKDAAAMLCAATLLDVSPARASNRAGRIQHFGNPQDFLDFAALDGLDARGRGLLRALHHRVFEADPLDYVANLHHHLGLMNEAIRASGAQPVLLTYPFRKKGLWEAHGEAAQLAKWRFVDTSVRFAEMAEQQPDVELFVRDGHCNDRGYALMAECVAESLAR